MRCSASRRRAGRGRVPDGGQDALIRVRLELWEAAFGTVKPLNVETAVVCPKCQGTGAADGTQPEQCKTCKAPAM